MPLETTQATFPRDAVGQISHPSSRFDNHAPAVRHAGVLMTKTTQSLEALWIAAFGNP